MDGGVKQWVRRVVALVAVVGAGVVVVTTGWDRFAVGWWVCWWVGWLVLTELRFRHRGEGG